MRRSSGTRETAPDRTPVDRNGWCRDRHVEAASRIPSLRSDRGWSLGLIGLTVVLAGCGGGGGPPLGTVSGIVSLDGSPLKDATVTFAPASGRPSQGVTDGAGRYTLDYTLGRPGAVIGLHSVRISTEGYVQGADGSVEQRKERVPATYNAQSTLTAEVKAGDNELSFELRSK
jgi:hypothetical protein